MSAPPLASQPGSSSPVAFLSGGGEMGALMRGLDWSRTPVGPISAWPQSLKTAVSIMLDSGYPMYIAWGPAFTQFYNDAFRPILGSEKHPAALGGGTEDTFSEIWEFVGAMFQRVVREGQNTTFANQMLPLDRNGYLEECYFSFSYSPIRDESGAVGGVFVTVSETTERVLAERRLRTLREVAEGTAAGGASQRAACSAALEILGKNQLDVPFALLYLLDEARERVSLAAATGIEPGTPASPERIELQDTAAPWPLALAAQSGHTCFLADVDGLRAPLPPGPWPESIANAVVLPLSRSGQEQPAGFLVAGVSARRRLDEGYRSFFELAAGQIAIVLANARAYEEERRRAAALAELDRAKTAFFANVSHEFRTPLTLLLGPLEDALRAGVALPAEIAGSLRVAHRNALRLQKLVNSLLDFSRLEAGRVQAFYEPVDLCAFTTELASTFRSAVERAGLALEVRCQPLSQPVYVDREMWEKVVLNLLSNAFKYTLEGTIAVLLFERGANAVLTVSDTGIGIPERELPHLFERFHRVERARGRSQEGTGIGLALIQELVKLHGGAVSVKSAPDRGSEFTVSIPFGSAHLPPDRLSASDSRDVRPRPEAYVDEALGWLPETAIEKRAGMSPVAAPQPEDGPRRRVLLAEDNADMRAYVRRLLETNYEVTPVANGLEALEEASRQPPDLVLSDIMMPGLDGFGLLAALRGREATRNIPVVLLSARSGEEAQSEGMEAGADDYLAKPFSARELMARVRAHLDISHARKLAAEAMRASEERLRQVWTQAPVAVCVLQGEELMFELANPLYRQFFPGRALVGRTLSEAVPELSPEVFDILRNVLRTGEPFAAKRFPVALDRDLDGIAEECWFDFVYQPLRDAAGRVSGVVVVAVDVGADVRAQRELGRANRELEEFAYVASHDLQEPLRMVNVYTQLLQRELAPHYTDLAREYARYVHQGVKRMEQLLTDLLSFSRVIYAGQDKAEPVYADLNASLAYALQTLQVRIADAGAVIEATPLPMVAGDEGQLGQVFQNLISNALKYRKPGSIPRVTISSKFENGLWVTIVEDQGIGFEPEYSERIFGLFKRLHKDAFPGTGLGLAICKRIVERYEGRIWAESKPGEGARFSFALKPGPSRTAAETGS